MEVAVSTLRAHLGEWLDRVQSGEEVVVTERGLPIARLSGLGSTAVIDQLTRDGVITKPERADRPVARGRQRIRAVKPVSDLIGEQRR